MVFFGVGLNMSYFMHEHSDWYTHASKCSRMNCISWPSTCITWSCACMHNIHAFSHAWASSWNSPSQKDNTRNILMIKLRNIVIMHPEKKWFCFTLSNTLIQCCHTRHRFHPHPTPLPGRHRKHTLQWLQRQAWFKALRSWGWVSTHPDSMNF